MNLNNITTALKTGITIYQYFKRTIIMRTALYYIGLGLILVLALNSSGPNLNTFIPGNPWEHYCKYELHKHPFHTNEKEYNYFLDTFTSTDKYEQIMEIYANPR